MMGVVNAKHIDSIICPSCAIPGFSTHIHEKKRLLEGQSLWLRLWPENGLKG
jgi:hypothetical protein